MVAPRRWYYPRLNFTELSKLSGEEETLQMADLSKYLNISDQQKSRRASSISNAKKFEPLDSTHKIDIKEEVYTASQEELKRSHNDSILKRIPEGSEATTVLVGAVGFLDQPTIAFVRLAQGILMPSITEVPIPVRFMFILLGPTTADLDYHEIGRSISTLMSNPQFHKIAYKADDRRDLLSAINEFLDDSIVLPPGDWDRHALLPFDEFKAKSDMIKRRKQSVIDRKNATAAAAGLIPPLITMDEQKKALLEQEFQMPHKHKVNPLERTGVPFGGLINDIKRRYPHYLSDFKDALNGSCLAATIFMYFAAVSSAITFGGLLNAKTHGWIGISETLVFTSIGGIVFALLGGQPLMITGATGPLLLFDESLYHFCESQQISYLVARMYMGLWIVVIALTVACFEGSVLVKKFTRFTEDIFASLISMIFIAEPIQKLIEIYKDHPLLKTYCALDGTNSELTSELDPGTLKENDIMSTVMSESSTSTTVTAMIATQSVVDGSGVVPQPNTALFCTMLTLGTFTIAYYLRIFRNGKFLGRSVRRALGDFGVPIAIIIMVSVACLIDQVFTETLRVPEGLSPSMPGRNWLVFTLDGNADFPVWAMFATAVPALMVYIIVFMETHIAELIIDKPERNLKKGSGFHMDIVLVSLVNCICGMTGAPWQCVATVRSVSHVSALTIMSTTHAPGDKPYIVEVKEQRLTGLLVSLLVGLSVLMSQYLRMVPIAVLFGVFLYMGISSINGIQFFDRVILFFKPVKHHPQVPYVRRVPTIKMHLFTLIQLIALGILYVVKSSKISLAFPFFLIMMVPLRFALQYVFTPLELRALDGKTPEKDQDDEPDFYEEAPLPG